jgi:xanthine phosphoribosyltransferase
LEQRILADGIVLPGNILNVGSFLNQMIDTQLLAEMGQEVARLYQDAGITKVLTIEASGIPLAVASAHALGVPAIFAKKGSATNVSADVLSAEVYSYTHRQTYHIVVNANYLGPDDVVLLVDDFLANGKALMGLTEIVRQSGAKLAGAAIAIEKGFQDGGKDLREAGVRVESLAIVESMTDNSLTFREQ